MLHRPLHLFFLFRSQHATTPPYLKNRRSEMKNMDVLTSSGVFVLVVAITLGLARAGSWVVMKIAERSSNKFTL